jgi:hypothetical protein
MADFQWQENLACVATYKVLEGDQFLDQFEDTEIAFEDAADVPMKRLRYFPKTTTNPQIIEVVSLEIAREFLITLVKVFTVKKEDPTISTPKTIKAIAGVFKNPKKTIANLAELVDEHVRFPDEA